MTQLRSSIISFVGIATLICSYALCHGQYNAVWCVGLGKPWSAGVVCGGQLVSIAVEYCKCQAPLYGKIKLFKWIFRHLYAFFYIFYLFESGKGKHSKKK